jgi:hypothetical protein
MPANQIGIFLIRQRLDRRGVEALAAIAERQKDRKLTNNGLAGPCWCGDQHS